MKIKPFVMIMGFVNLIGQPAFSDADPLSFLKNRQAIQALDEKKLAEAQEKIISALATNPLDARLHLNLGLTFEMLSQPEKAQASYEQALKLAEDDQARFAANYNLGQLAQRARKVDTALQYYQEALRYQPESKETKINIELLIQESQNQQNQQQQQQDQKDQGGQGEGEDQKDQKNNQNNQNDQKEQQQKEQPQQVQQPKPRPKFNSEELTPGDAKKILGEIKQQEQKIRAEFNRKEVREQPLDKDW